MKFLRNSPYCSERHRCFFLQLPLTWHYSPYKPPWGSTHLGEPVIQSNRSVDSRPLSTTCWVCIRKKKHAKESRLSPPVTWSQHAWRTTTYLCMPCTYRKVRVKSTQAPNHQGVAIRNPSTFATTRNDLYDYMITIEKSTFFYSKNSPSTLTKSFTWSRHKYL